jgi:hypothetical protein
MDDPDDAFLADLYSATALYPDLPPPDPWSWHGYSVRLALIAAGGDPPDAFAREVLAQDPAVRYRVTMSAIDMLLVTRPPEQAARLEALLARIDRPPGRPDDGRIDWRKYGF